MKDLLDRHMYKNELSARAITCA